MLATHRATRCILAVLLSIASVLPAQAFKVDTHVFIAQQLLIDLEKSDKLQFEIDGVMRTAAVAPHIRQAILDHPAAFALGSIGPDALPGIYEGQMTIHPGHERGWGTGEWLMNLTSKATTPEELAFTYGMLIHAAGDIFAHTYVNKYAGDIYLLTDGEIDVERRHFMLEGYISEKLPRLKLSNGDLAPDAARQITSAGLMRPPAALLRRAWLEDGDAAREWGRNGSSHLQVIHELREQLLAAVRKDGPMDKAHLLAQKVLIYYYSDLKVSDEQLRKLNKLHGELQGLTNEGIDWAQDLDQRIREFVQGVMKAPGEFEQKALKNAQDALHAFDAMKSDKDAAELAAAKALDDLRQLVQPPCISVPQVCVAVTPPCRSVLGHRFPPDCGRRACTPAHRVCPPNVMLPGLQSTVAAKQSVLKNIDVARNSVLAKYREAMGTVLASVRATMDAENAVIRASVDFLQRFNEDVDPMQSLVRAWIADIEDAMGLYYVANSVAIRNAIEGKDPLDPLKRWASCDFSKILGKPAQIADASCMVKDLIKLLGENFDKLEALAARDVPVLEDLLAIRKTLEEAATTAAKKELVSFGSKIVGADIQQLVDLIKLKPTAASLNQEFARKNVAKALLVIDDASKRVDADMHLGADGRLDPEKFAPLRNAIVLSRLALLSALEVNELLQQPVLDPTKREDANLLFKFARSIDGDHQWLPFAPPYIRKPGEHRCSRSYGSGASPLWTENRGRRLFQALFVGPLAPGLETPVEFKLGDVLPDSYPYRPTAAEPFPHWSESMNTGGCSSLVK